MDFALVVLVIGVALVFDYINGFHDAANSIATVVSTRVLSPGKAVIWAAFFNFVAAFVFGTAVAKTIGSGMIDIIGRHHLGDPGRPDRRDRLGPDHLVLRPADQLVARADRRLRRGAVSPRPALAALIPSGWTKTLIFIVLAPGIGFVLGFVFMVATLWIFRDFAPSRVDRWFRKLQLVSAAAYSLGHGGNDAQKTMGIIAGALFAGGLISEFRIPISGWCSSAHAAISLGTLSGGWRIIHTMGSKITRLQPVGGFAAETAGAVSLFTATSLGVPVSTTHTITGAIVGVGATRRLSAVRWGIAGQIVWAWILTIPASAAIAAGTFYVLHAVGMP